MPKSVDRIDLLRLFIRIAETGSLTAAGRSLGLSQPSASRQLRALEEELGVELVLRSTHEVSLTEAGRHLLASARSVVTDWEELRDTLRGADSAVAGRLRVLAPLGLGQTVLADIAAKFVRANPGVQIDWLLDDAPRDLIADGIDLWIRIGNIPDDALIVRRLTSIRRVFVGHANHPPATSPEALADRPAVVLSPYMPRALDLIGPDCARATLQPQAAASTDNLFVAERLARAGVGYALLPAWLVQPHIDAGVMTLLCPGWHPASLALSLAFPRTRYRPARTRAFIAFLSESVTVDRLTAEPA